MKISDVNSEFEKNIDNCVSNIPDCTIGFLKAIYGCVGTRERNVKQGILFMFCIHFIEEFIRPPGRMQINKIIYARIWSRRVNKVT